MSEQEEVKMKKSKEKEFTIADLPGVGPATMEKLVTAGYDTLLAISVSSPGELVEVGGFTENAARKIIKSARDMMGIGFESGEDLLKKREQVTKISTGSRNFDSMLGGGFESGGISECFGEFGSSKSQIAHQLAVNVQLPKEKGGNDGKAIFIDTESTFRPERIVQMATALKLDSQEALKNIKVARAFNSDHQMLLAEKAEDLIKTGEYKLLIVDSLTSHFRADFSGRGELASRQQKLNRHMHTLMKLAMTYNICVYVTNQVMAKPDTFFGDPTAAIGGHIVGHNCLMPGTMIQLGNGLIKPIEEIYNYNDVVSFDLKNSLKSDKNRIGTIVIKNGDGKVYDIKTTRHIKSSGKHRFFRIDSLDIEEVRAEQLNVGDYILQAFDLDICGEEQKLPKIDIPKIAKLSEEGVGLVKESIKNINRKELCNNLSITPRQFRRVLNQRYPTDFNNFHNLSANYVGGQLLQFVDVVESNKHRNYVIPETLNAEFAQILGYFLGDGGFEERSLRFRDARYDVLETYNNLFNKNFKICGGIRKINGKNCFNLDINNKIIRDLIYEVYRDLFDYISKSPKQHICAFLRGFFDAEGSVSKKQPRISASQKDEKVLTYIQLLLDRIGIRSAIRTYLHKGNRIFQIDIKDMVSVLRYSSMIGFSAIDKNGVLNKWKNHCERSYDQEMTPIKRKDLWNLIKSFGISPSKILKSRQSSYKYVGMRDLKKIVKFLLNTPTESSELKNKLDFLIKLISSEIKGERINQINIEDYDGVLYDFAVPNTENYIANGFIAHNSQTRVYLRKGKKGSRVAKLIDSPHLADAESIFMVVEDGIRDL